MLPTNAPMEHSKMQPTHLWCTNAPRDLARQVLREYCQDIEPTWAGPAEEYLCMCSKCLDNYQEGKRILLEQEPNMNEILKFRESLRLRAWIGAYIEQRGNDVPESDLAIFQENSKCNAGGQLQQPMRELLQHPKLLFCEDLNASFVKYVEFEYSRPAQPSYAAPIPVTQIPGILMLLIHPNQMVRKWASRMLPRDPPITTENYNEVDDIITCMLSPVEFGLFDTCDDDTMGSEMLPRDLVCINDKQAYWKGIMQVLRCLDKDATRTRLMGPPPGGHRTIADALVNIIMESKQNDTSVFWPALECFEVLLSKLEYSLWQHISLPPDQILKDIVSHPVFEIALSGQQQKSTFASSSSARSSSFKDITTHADLFSSKVNANEPFIWLRTFVHSFLDIGDPAHTYINSVILFLVHRAACGLDPENSYFDNDGSISKDAFQKKQQAASMVKKVMTTFLDIMESLLQMELYEVLIGSAHRWPHTFVLYLQREHPPPGVDISRSQYQTKHRCVKIMTKLLQRGLQLDHSNQGCAEFLKRMNPHSHIISGNRYHRRARRPFCEGYPLGGMNEVDIERFNRTILDILQDLKEKKAEDGGIVETSMMSYNSRKRRNSPTLHKEHEEANKGKASSSSNSRSKLDINRSSIINPLPGTSSKDKPPVASGEPSGEANDSESIRDKTKIGVDYEADVEVAIPPAASFDGVFKKASRETQKFANNRTIPSSTFKSAPSNRMESLNTSVTAPDVCNGESPDFLMNSQPFKVNIADDEDKVAGAIPPSDHNVDSQDDLICTQEFEPHSDLEDDAIQDDVMGMLEFEPHSDLEGDGMSTQEFEPHSDLEEDEFQDDVNCTQPFEPHSDVEDVKLQDNDESISPPTYSEPITTKQVKLCKRKVSEFRLKLLKLKDKSSSGRSNDKPSFTTENDLSSKIDENNQVSHATPDGAENEPQLITEESSDVKSFSSNESEFDPSAVKRDCSYSIQVSKRKIVEYLSKISKLKDTKSKGGGNDKPSYTTESDMSSQEDEDIKDEHDVSHDRPKTEETPDVIKLYHPFPDVILKSTRQQSINDTHGKEGKVLHKKVQSSSVVYQSVTNSKRKIAHQPSNDDGEPLQKKNRHQEHPSGQPDTLSFGTSEQSKRLPSGAREPVNIQVNQPHHAQAVNDNQSATRDDIIPDRTHRQQTPHYQPYLPKPQDHSGERGPIITPEKSCQWKPRSMTITDPQLTAATLQQPTTAGLQQSSINEPVQQLQLPPHLQAQAAQLGGQFILTKTDPKELPALGMLQKCRITQQQLQDTQVISQGPKLKTGKVRQHLQGGAINTILLRALRQPQQVALPAAHLISSKEGLQGGKETNAIKQVQPAGIQHPLMSFVTVQSQQIQAQFKGHLQPHTPTSLQHPGKVTQPQTTQTPITSTINPSLQQGQVRPMNLLKMIRKQQPQPSSKSSTFVTTPTLQAFPISTPTSNVGTTIATTSAQPIIVNQRGVQQRFIQRVQQTVPNQPGTVHMPISATLAQQLAQARSQVTGPLGHPFRSVTCQPQSPIMTQTNPQGLNISHQLIQAGIRQPLPSIQSFTCRSTSTSTLVSPHLTEVRNIQLQAQAKLATRIPSTTSQQRTMMSPLQGRITTVDRRGVLSSAHVIPGNSIQVHGALPQTSMIPAGQMTSQSTGAQALPIQATTIPTSLMSSQANAETGQAGVALQKSNMTGAAVQINNIVMQQEPWGTAVVQQAMQARLVHQQSGGQGNVATTSTAPTNPSSQYFTPGKFK